MAEAFIPVNLLNPGQVFASLGFLEVADALLGEAEGGFDWSDQSLTRFHLRAHGQENPVAAVLEFMAEADIQCYAPVGFQADAGDAITLSESFPDREGDRMALPIRLQSARGIVSIGHWADSSTGRDSFKLYAGNRTGHSIAHAMLRGTAKTKGVRSLWREQRDVLVAQPFDVLTPMGGSFNLDPRSGWTAIDAGYSPNDHGDHVISASPVVELLAACGLEHARPDEFEKRRVRYAAWTGLVPPVLARPALAGIEVPLVMRRFRFVLDLSGKNKVVTFAQEEKGV